jgi:hypothetical protein
MPILNTFECDNSVTINNYYFSTENNFSSYEEAFKFYIKYYNIDKYVDLEENGKAFNFIFWLNMFCSAYLWSYIICLTYVITLTFIIKTTKISESLINLTSFVGCIMGIYLLNNYRIIYLNLLISMTLTGLLLWILSLEITKYFNYTLIIKSMVINISISFLMVSTLAMTESLTPKNIYT